MTLIVGMATGLIAVFVTFCTKALTVFKLRPVYAALHAEGGPTVRAFLIMLGFNLAYVVVANSLVWLEPLAAGSGIPEIKSFLNGIDLPRVVSGLSSCQIKEIGRVAASDFFNLYSGVLQPD